MAGLHCFIKFKGKIMKKVMLFIASMLFAVGVNAATLNLTNAGTTAGVSQDTSSLTNEIVSGFGQTGGSSSWSSLFSLTTTEDTMGVVEWSFNPEAAITTAVLQIFDVTNNAVLATYNVVGDFITSFQFFAGTTYGIDFRDVDSTATRYDVTVSAVPVPAALFLLAPALFGFLGLRRKTVSTSVVAA
tara:strand:- start:117000 stop:117560 length:561 start_codon:yes stop_codon:yes gene_type:complete